MRAYWCLYLVAVVGFSGCASGGGFSLWPTTAKSSPATMPMQIAQPKKTGFTDKVVTSITSVIPGMGEKSKSSGGTKNSLMTDPIALGYGSKAPNAELYLSMAKMSDRSGKTDEARAMYQKALSLEPNHRDAMLGLARLEDRQGRIQEAMKIYQQAATQYPQDVKVLNDLALCYARAGKLAESAELLHQATLLHPQKKLYRNNFAKVLIEMNRFEEAVSQLAIVHGPAIAQYNMGVLLKERGRTDEAVGFLTAATKLDPQLQEASSLLAQLQGVAEESTKVAVDNSILPTPMPTSAPVGGQRYPTTSAPAHPVYQTMPAETAKAVVGETPISLPAVR